MGLGAGKGGIVKIIIIGEKEQKKRGTTHVEKVCKMDIITCLHFLGDPVLMHTLHTLPHTYPKYSP